ncbi:hypothetical protein Tco_1289912, partial [Tanacetum coccineum]
VMSTPTHIDSETISQTNGSRSSRVPIPLLDDPYMAVRKAYIATIMDSESEPFEDFRETKIPQQLPIALSPPKEAPSETEELQPLPARTTLPSSDHTPTSPNPTLVLPHTDEEFEASEPLDTKITDPVIVRLLHEVLQLPRQST